MKKTALAATLLAASGFAFAQADAPKAPAAADVPKPNCGEKPEYPGKLAMQSDLRRNAFKRDVDKYKDCIMAFVEARKAAYKVNLDAANNAISEYNDTMKKLAAEQEAAKGN